MPSISLFVHILSLLFFIFCGWKVLTLLEEKRFLLGVLLNRGKKGFFLVKNPISFLRFVSLLLDIPFYHKSGGKFFPKRKVRVDRFFGFLLSVEVESLEYWVCLEGQKDATLQLRIAHLSEDFHTFERDLSKDLGMKVIIKDANF